MLYFEQIGLDPEEDNNEEGGPMRRDTRPKPSIFIGYIYVLMTARPCH